MSARVIDIHDFLPVMMDPPPRHDEPAVLITLPVIRIERAPMGAKTGKRDAAHDDGLPCDC